MGQFCSLSSSQSILYVRLEVVRICMVSALSSQHLMLMWTRQDYICRIGSILYLENAERLREPDSSKLSQRHFLKDIPSWGYVLEFRSKICNRFVTLSKNVKLPAEIWPILLVFFARRDLFFYFFQISDIPPKPNYTGRHIRVCLM